MQKYVLLLSLVACAACSTNNAEKQDALSATSQKCTIDIKALSGSWILEPRTQDGTAASAQTGRLVFQNDGDQVLAHFGPSGLPDRITNIPRDFCYTRTSTDAYGELLYTHPRLAELPEEQLRAKQQQDLWNDPTATVFEDRLYIRVDPKTCKLRVGDLFFTFHKGQPIEDSNSGRMGYYVPDPHPQPIVATCPKLPPPAPAVDDAEPRGAAPTANPGSNLPARPQP